MVSETKLAINSYKSDKFIMNYFFGFSYWKHEFLKPFLQNLDASSIIFINPFLKNNYFNEAVQKGLNKNSTIYIWGKKEFPLIEEFAIKYGLSVFRIEDGFIRSVGLGSDLTQPYSLVIDSRGIYFDPSQVSDLEYILETTTFDKSILKRSKAIREYLIEKKLSKYNLYKDKHIDVPKNKKIVLVPGQVEDDASIKYGANGMSNIELLKEARKNAKNAYIIYKPHPDVLSGNRIGNIKDKTTLKYADTIITEVGLDSVLEVCNEVHTMTSLVGFEALMRHKTVYTYGSPFYAGWGLTNDKFIQKKRKKRLDLDELVAATLIKYPIYIHPKSLEVCEVEECLNALEEEKNLYNISSYYRVKTNLRNYASRKIQLIVRIFNYRLNK